MLWLKHQAAGGIIFFSAVDSLPGAWKIIGCFVCYQFFSTGNLSMAMGCIITKFIFSLKTFIMSTVTFCITLQSSLGWGHY